MRIALIGRISNKIAMDPFFRMLQYLLDSEHEIKVYEPLALYIKKNHPELVSYKVFKKPSSIKDIDVVFSIGGDGTLLETVSLFGEKQLPILGINAGRLGFLASIPIDDMINSLETFFAGNYKIEERSLVHFISKDEEFDEFPYGLNELAIQKRDTSSMILIHAFINGEFLNSYWADGLIISTATGSTGYSLSCGGPLMVPTNDSFIISPLNPHNLNVRPMVVSGESELTFKIEGRAKNILVSLDSRSKKVSSSIDLKIKKADFKVKLIQLETVNYFDTLRKKLNWGLDVRN